MRVGVHPELVESLQPGQEVVLNDSMSIVMARTHDTSGEVVTVKEVLAGGQRALVVGRGDEERVAELAEDLVGSGLHSGDLVMLDPRSRILLEVLPRPEVEDLVLEEIPEVSYDDVGGLDRQIEQIVDAVELPFLHLSLIHI